MVKIPDTPTVPIMETMPSALPYMRNLFNLKRWAGGRLIQPICQEIACHFSQDHTMIAKFLDFINKHPIYIDGSSRLIGNHDFLGSKIKNFDFFNF